ncbi:MAG TPA: hypothetical protein VM032_08140 [Vicinamibacterales bacterium]|nr:hypothetical protein [Vicinamibacterales bacterium]
MREDLAGGLGRHWRHPGLICVLAALWAGWVWLHVFALDPGWNPQFLDHPLGAHPYLIPALTRGIRAVLGAALTALAAWQLGSVVADRAHGLFIGRFERVPFTMALGTVALGSMLLLASGLGVYRPAVLIAVLVGSIVLRLRALLHEARGVPRALARGLAAAGATGADRVTLLLGCVAIGCAFVAALAPEVEYDALWYHLWLPAQWLAHGRLVDIVPEYVSLYPGGWELLNGAAMSLGGPIAAKLLHFACLLLCAAAACLLAREVAPRVSMASVAVFCVCAPTMLWEASTAYVDLALAWYVTLATVALFRYWSTLDVRWILVAGVMAGGGLGVKHLGLVALATQATLLLLAEVRSRRTAAAFAAPMFVAVALSLALPWYARTYAASGNPVFPEMYAVFGARPAARWSEVSQEKLQLFQQRFGFGRGVAALASLPWDVTTHAERFGGTFGSIFLVLVPFAVQRGRRRPLVLAAGVAAWGAVWASPLSSLQARFLIPVVPLLAVLAAIGLQRIERSGRLLANWLPASARFGVLVVLTLGLPPFIALQERDRQGWNGWLTHVLRAAPLAVVTGAESEDAYLARNVPSYRAWQRIDAVTPASAVVLTFMGGDHLYSHRDRIWSDSTAAYQATWGAPAGHNPAMFEALRTLGITHVLFDKDPRHTAGVDGLAIASAEVRECCLALIYEDAAAAVYEMRMPGADTDASAALGRR